MPLFFAGSMLAIKFRALNRGIISDFCSRGCKVISLQSWRSEKKFCCFDQYISLQTDMEVKIAFQISLNLYRYISEASLDCDLLGKEERLAPISAKFARKCKSAVSLSSSVNRCCFAFRSGGNCNSHFQNLQF